MNIQQQNQPGKEADQKTPGEQNQKTSGENIEISKPHNERPSGPFEHSGETAGWTKEEKEEQQDKEGQQPG